MNEETDQKTTDNKFSGRRIALLTVLVLLSTGIICGLVYWKSDQVVQIKNSQIHSLTEQINTTSEQIHDLSSK